jgi:hypothetical protein
MNTQKSIATFHELLTSDEDESIILTAIRKLMEVKDPETIREPVSREELGAWSGWPT